MSLARIVGEERRVLGIYNIMAYAQNEEKGTVLFDNNGSSIVDPLTSYYQHEKFIQSTPTQRGQFRNLKCSGFTNYRHVTCH